MSKDGETAWVALSLVRGVGNVTYRRLLERFQDPDGVFVAGARALLEAGVHPEVADAIVNFRRWEEAERYVSRARRVGGSLLHWNDSRYPRLLREVHDAPPFLFVRGDPGDGDELCVAVVGSRVPSVYGRGRARALCTQLARVGVTVVSGLARGIDGEAHRATLDAGGRTVAVLGCGIDVVYPPEHARLFRRIVENGAVLSELLPGVGPEAGHFPRRNRLLAGMTVGTVVVEAGEHSGSLITARWAADQGREVFAVPGPIGPLSRGPHRLIRQGAKLTETAADILEEIAPSRLRTASREERRRDRPEFEDRLLRCLQGGPHHIDALCAKMGAPVGTILEALLGLELEGAVVQYPGKYFALSGSEPD